MTIQSFFEELGPQLGVAEVRTSQRKRKRRRTSNSIVPKPGLTGTQTALWFLFSHVRDQTYKKLQLPPDTTLTMDHVNFMRDLARMENYAKQREQLQLGKRNKFLDVEEAWDLWQERFEHIIQGLLLELEIRPSPAT